MFHLHRTQSSRARAVPGRIGREAMVGTARRRTDERAGRTRL